MLRDIHGVLTGEEWYVKAIEARGWELTVWRNGGRYIAEIHDIPGNGTRTDYLPPIVHYESRMPTRACRAAYMVAIGKLLPWSLPKLDT